MVVNILVDSATKPTSPKQKSGESTAAWAMWNSATMHEPPIRCGISYFNHNLDIASFQILGLAHRNQLLYLLLLSNLGFRN